MTTLYTFTDVFDKYDGDSWMCYEFEDGLAIEIGNNFEGVSVFNIDDQGEFGTRRNADLSYREYRNFISYVFNGFEKDYEEYR